MFRGLGGGVGVGVGGGGGVVDVVDVGWKFLVTDFFFFRKNIFLGSKKIGGGGR